MNNGSPLIPHFSIVENFSYYTVEELARILAEFSNQTNIHAEESAFDKIAQYASGTPHVAINLFLRAHDYAVAAANSTSPTITDKIASSALEMMDFEEWPEKVALVRDSIPQKVRLEVWRRDRGQCARCGRKEKLEFDHIIPVSKGGSNTTRNIELLCEKCNRAKADKIW
jgi:hypothetical protein